MQQQKNPHLITPFIKWIKKNAGGNRKELIFEEKITFFACPICRKVLSTHHSPRPRKSFLLINRKVIICFQHTKGKQFPNISVSLQFGYFFSIKKERSFGAIWLKRYNPMGKLTLTNPFQSCLLKLVHKPNLNSNMALVLCRNPSYTGQANVTNTKHYFRHTIGWSLLGDKIFY